MSPSTFNSLFTEMVEAGKAMEELPQVREQLAFTESKCREYQETIANREERILNLKSEVEALQSKVRDAEVARDDAELRFLELDEKAGKALASMGNILANLNDATNILTPPKPEPAEPEPVKAEPYKEPEWAMDHTQGQSESVTSGEKPSEQTSASSSVTTDATSEKLGENIPTHSGPYEGKLYYDHPTYVPLSEWLDGGGSEENYYRSRPAREQSSII